MKLRHKYLSIMAIPVVVLVGGTALTYAADSRAAANVAAVARTSEVHLKVRDVLDDLVDSETGTRGYMLTGDTVMLEPFDEGSAALPSDLAELRDLVSDDGLQAERLDRLTPLVEERMAILARQQALGAVRGDAERSVAAPLLERGGLVMADIREVLGEMRESEESSLQALQLARENADERSNAIQFVLLPLVMLVSLVMVIAMSDRIVRRVLRIEENVMRLERGDEPLPPDESRDEVGALARQMVEIGSKLVDAQEEARTLAITDPLTGIANRRGFMIVAEAQIELARRDRRNLTLAFIDVDGLKRVNDVLGHDRGDQLIREVAALISDSVRAADTVARVGGDEFCVLFMGSATGDATEAIARIDHAVRWADGLPGRDYRIAVSIGTADLDDHTRSVEGLLREADQAMYRAKRAKRSPIPVEPV